MLKFENRWYNGESPGLGEEIWHLLQLCVSLGFHLPHVETEGTGPDQGCSTHTVFPWQTSLIHHGTASHQASVDQRAFLSTSFPCLRHPQGVQPSQVVRAGTEIKLSL